MNKNLYLGISLVCMLFLGHIAVRGQTVGLLSHSSGSEDDGYVLFSPETSDSTYLIDKCGRRVHTWASHYTPGLDFYLLPDGTLLRTGNYPNAVFDPVGGTAGGIIQRFDWNDNLLWHYIISSPTETQNHDVCYMPNGDILVAIWEVINDSVALANGRNTSFLGSSVWTAKIVELQPIGTDSAKIVWTWRVMDHLVQDYDSTKANYGVVADHPELLNFNYINLSAIAATNPDWLHFNAITYNPALDQVMISFHNNDEIYILDHSTDSAGAAAHSGGVHNKGGDFLYRWGNPQAYGRGTAANTKFFQQHDPTWIPFGPYANQIMVFNNGYGRGIIASEYASSVDIIAPPVDAAGDYAIVAGEPYGPTALSWTYQTGHSFYSQFMGGAQPLTNGDVLICNAMKGQLFEIDSTKNIDWNYQNPVNANHPVAQGTTVLNSAGVYRCTFYPSTYSGFAGQTLVAGDPIELNPSASTCGLNVAAVPMLTNTSDIRIRPNPANNMVTVETNDINTILLTDITGRTIVNHSYAHATSADINTAALANGMYILNINGTNYQRLVIQH